MFIFVCIVLSGFCLRLAWVGLTPLWQDEAETVVYALQIEERGYPNGHFQNRPLYENASYAPSDDPEFAFKSTNYLVSEIERHKGWAPVYLLAALRPLWENNVALTRLPFVAISLGTIIVLFAIGNLMGGVRFGLGASAFHAFNYFAIFFEHQARYFAMTSFVFLLFLYLLLRMLKGEHNKGHIGTALIVILLFYTHIVYCIVGALMYIGVLLYFRQTGRAQHAKSWAFSLLLIAACTFPWIFITKAWTMFSEGFALSIAAKIIWNVLILICMPFIGFVLWTFTRVKEYPWGTYLVYICVILTVIVTGNIVPGESHNARLYSSLLPLFALLITGSVIALWRKTSLQTVFVTATILVIGYFTQIGIGGHPLVGSALWVRPALAYLENHAAGEDIPVFVTFQHFSFWVYAPERDVQLVWPVRKSYFDTYPGRMIFFIHDDQGPCGWFYLYRRDCLAPPHEEKLSSCTASVLTSEVTVYDCPARSLTTSL